MQTITAVGCFLVVISWNSASALLAAKCTDKQIEQIAAYASEVRDVMDSSEALVEPPDLPPLSCDPAAKLHEPLGRPLAEMIYEARKAEDVWQEAFLAKVLVNVRDAYGEAGHPTDFYMLSKEIFSRIDALQSAEGTDYYWPPAPPDRIVPSSERFKLLNGLIYHLEELPGRIALPSSTTIEISTTPPSTTTTTSEEWTTPSTTKASMAEEERAKPRFSIERIFFGTVVLIALGLSVAWLVKGSQGKDGLGRSEKMYVGVRRRPVAKGLPDGDGEAEMSGEGPGSSEVGDLRQLQSDMVGFRAILQGINERLSDAVNSTSERLDAVESELTKLSLGLETLQKVAGELSRRAGALEADVRSFETSARRMEARSLLEDLLRTEQDLLRRQWRRFLENRATKEIGELVEHFEDDEGYRILLKLFELQATQGLDRGLRETLESKLTPVLVHVQQLKLLGLVRRRAEDVLPEDAERQGQRFLLIRDSFQLLANFGNPETRDRVLRFKPAKWCAEEFPDIADLFLQAYQRAKLEGREAELEEGRSAVDEALRLGNLKPIEIVLGQTTFDSTVHVGKAYRWDASLDNGTVVGVIKNGFCSLRDGSVVISPEVEINRIDGEGDDYEPGLEFPRSVDPDQLEEEVAAIRGKMENGEKLGEELGDLRSWMKVNQKETDGQLLDVREAVSDLRGKIEALERSGVARMDDSSLTTLRERVEELSVNIRLQDGLRPITDSLGFRVQALEAHIGRLKEVERRHSDEELAPLASPQPTLEEILETEKALLNTALDDVMATMPGIGELVENVADDEVYRILVELAGELARAVGDDRDLYRACLSRLEAVREFSHSLEQLDLAKKLVAGEGPEDPRRRLMQIRTCLQLVANLTGTGLGEKILRFQPSTWCAEELPELADLFLRFYANAEAEGKSEPLDRPRQILLDALGVGQLEPVEIVLGETMFDGDIHVDGPSASDPSYPDGAIVEVIRNGFRSLRDGRIIIQPEVIVNRI